MSEATGGIRAFNFLQLVCKDPQNICANYARKFSSKQVEKNTGGMANSGSNEIQPKELG